MQFGAYTFVETRRDPRTGEPVDVDKSFRRCFGADRTRRPRRPRCVRARRTSSAGLCGLRSRRGARRGRRAHQAHSPDERCHGPVVGRSGARLSAIRHPRSHLEAAGPRSWPDAARSSSPSRYSAMTSTITTNCSRKSSISCFRFAPSLRSRGKAGIARRSTARGVYPRALQQPLPVWIASGGTPQSVARAGALGLPLAIAIIGGRAGAICTAGGALSRGGSPRRRRARQAHGRHQWPWLPRRHGRSRGRRVLRSLRRGDEPDRPRARLAAVVARAIRSGPGPTRTFDGRNAGRGHRRKSSLSTRSFATIAISCRCRSATSRKTRSCARSSFSGRSSRPKCARNWRSTRPRAAPRDGRRPGSGTGRLIADGCRPCVSVIKV